MLSLLVVLFGFFFDMSYRVDSLIALRINKYSILELFIPKARLVLIKHFILLKADIFSSMIWCKNGTRATLFSFVLLVRHVEGSSYKEATTVERERCYSYMITVHVYDEFKCI